MPVKHIETARHIARKRNAGKTECSTGGKNEKERRGMDKERRMRNRE